jgi:hypothetical protein
MLRNKIRIAPALLAAVAAVVFAALNGSGPWGP